MCSINKDLKLLYKSLFIVLSKQRSSQITSRDPPRSRAGSLVDLFVALDRAGGKGVRGEDRRSTLTDHCQREMPE